MFKQTQEIDNVAPETYINEKLPNQIGPLMGSLRIWKKERKRERKKETTLGEDNQLNFLENKGLELYFKGINQSEPTNWQFQNHLEAYLEIQILLHCVLKPPVL